MSPTTTFRSIAAGLFALIVILIQGCDGGAKDEVKAVFEAYTAALRAKDGDAFLKLIDPENIKSYGYLVEVARSGDRLAVQRLTWTQKYDVTMLRNRFTVEELKKMDGAEYVRTCVNRGWFFAEDDGERFSLGPVTLKPPRANAMLVVDGDSTGYRFEFVEVEHQWLVNDECMEKWFNKEIEKLAALARVSEDTLILDLESDESGKKVTRDIWERPPQ
jgi:hypothetical protein